MHFVGFAVRYGFYHVHGAINSFFVHNGFSKATVFVLVLAAAFSQLYAVIVVQHPPNTGNICIQRHAVVGLSVHAVSFINVLDCVGLDIVGISSYIDTSQGLHLACGLAAHLTQRVVHPPRVGVFAGVLDKLHQVRVNRVLVLFNTLLLRLGMARSIIVDLRFFAQRIQAVPRIDILAFLLYIAVRGAAANLYGVRGAFSTGPFTGNRFSQCPFTDVCSERGFLRRLHFGGGIFLFNLNIFPLSLFLGILPGNVQLGNKIVDNAGGFAHGVRALGQLAALGSALGGITSVDHRAQLFYDLGNHVPHSLQNGLFLCCAVHACIVQVIAKLLHAVLGAHNAAQNVAGRFIRAHSAVAVGIFVLLKYMLLGSGHTGVAGIKIQHRIAGSGKALGVVAAHVVGQLVHQGLVAIAAVLAQRDLAQTGSPVPVYRVAVPVGQVLYHLDINAQLLGGQAKHLGGHVAVFQRQPVFIAHAALHSTGTGRVNRRGHALGTGLVGSLQGLLVVHHGTGSAHGVHGLLIGQRPGAACIVHAIHRLGVGVHTAALVVIGKCLAHGIVIARRFGSNALHFLHTALGSILGAALLHCRLGRFLHSLPGRFLLGHPLARFFLGLPGKLLGLLAVGGFGFISSHTAVNHLPLRCNLLQQILLVHILGNLLPFRCGGILYLLQKVLHKCLVSRLLGNVYRGCGLGVSHRCSRFLLCCTNCALINNPVRRIAVGRVVLHVGAAAQRAVDAGTHSTVNAAAGSTHYHIVCQLCQAKFGFRVFIGKVGQVVQYIAGAFLGGFAQRLLGNVLGYTLAAFLYNFDPVLHGPLDPLAHLFRHPLTNGHHLGAHLNAAAHGTAGQRFPGRDIPCAQLICTAASSLQAQRTQAQCLANARHQAQRHASRVACHAGPQLVGLGSSAG